MQVINEIIELVDEYRATGFKLFEFDESTRSFYQDALKETSINIVMKNAELYAHMNKGLVNLHEVYSNRVKLRIEYELVNACLSIIDGSVATPGIFTQIVNDIYNNETEKQLIYDLAKLKR